jgi:hypothetical protein
MAISFRLAFAQWTCLLVVFAGLLVAVPPAQGIKRKPSLEADDHPEVVLVTARNGKTGQVGRSTGVLIADKAVLTAAHSVSGFHSWEVVAPYAKSGRASAKAKAPAIHPDYKPDAIEHDLAVLVLDDPIDIGRDFPTLHHGELYPLNTKLVVVGRVENGTLSRTQLFKTAVSVAQFPGNINLYGGFPHVVEEGDSGGPVYAADKDHEIAALVSGNLGFTRSNVRIDVFIPISRKNRGWILRQLRE